ncbi:MAG: hypothetical protein ACM3Y9_14495, partial [Ignavibacteria bacterium]
MSSPSAADSLWKDPRYLLLWSSTLMSGLGGQIAGLATALLAAVVLQATPAQIGALGAVGAVPAVLLMLPAGVWLDRVRKLPVYIGGELVTAKAPISAATPATTPAITSVMSRPLR